MVTSRPSFPLGLTFSPLKSRPCPDTNMTEPTSTQPVRLSLGNLNGAGSACPIAFSLLSIVPIGYHRSCSEDCALSLPVRRCRTGHYRTCLPVRQMWRLTSLHCCGEGRIE